MKIHGPLAVIAFFNIPFIMAGPVQNPNIKLPDTAPSDRQAVKYIFESSYGLYRKFAFGHDEVRPNSQTPSDSRNGWGASIVDGLGTMAIMGLQDLIDEGVKFVSTIDFTKSGTPDPVSVFETTIRYVGGMLSAYELTGQKYPILVQKAQQVADKLLYAWVDNNTIPYGHLNFESNTPLLKSSNIAEAGTLTLEFGILSKYTKNQTYANLALKSAEHIARLPAPLPGLAAQGINPATGNPDGGYVTWGGGSDSCYEYYPKYTRLFNPSSSLFMDTWSAAIDSSIKTLLKTSTVGNFKYLGDFDDEKQVRHVSSHLACFHGGNWILGGKMLNNQTIVDIGLELADGCWNTYAGTRSGIGPEAFAFVSSDGNFTGNGDTYPAQVEFYKQHGFYITSPGYILRPEVLESNFYAWRATGDMKYYNRARSAVQSFFSYILLKNGGAAGLNNVEAPSTGIFDVTESFWFAEVMKYLYLTFDDPGTISLDTYVFNTEAHPFQVPLSSSYGIDSRSATSSSNKNMYIPLTLLALSLCGLCYCIALYF